MIPRFTGCNFKYIYIYQNYICKIAISPVMAICTLWMLILIAKWHPSFVLLWYQANLLLSNNSIHTSKHPDLYIFCNLANCSFTVNSKETEGRFGRHLEFPVFVGSHKELVWIDSLSPKPRYGHEHHISKVDISWCMALKKCIHSHFFGGLALHIIGGPKIVWT